MIETLEGACAYMLRPTKTPKTVMRKNLKIAANSELTGGKFFGGIALKTSDR